MLKFVLCLLITAAKIKRRCANYGRTPEEMLKILEKSQGIIYFFTPRQFLVQEHPLPQDNQRTKQESTQIKKSSQLLSGVRHNGCQPKSG
jgi:hypothetical protein